MQFGGFASRWQGSTENISYNHDFYSGGVTYTKMLLLYGPFGTQAFIWTIWHPTNW